MTFEKYVFLQAISKMSKACYYLVRMHASHKLWGKRTEKEIAIILWMGEGRVTHKHVVKTWVLLFAWKPRAHAGFLTIGPIHFIPWMLYYFCFQVSDDWSHSKGNVAFSFLHWQVKLNATKRSFDTQKTDELTTFMRLASEVKQANVLLYGIQIDHTKVIVLNCLHVVKEQKNESCLHLLTCLTLIFPLECKKRIVTLVYSIQWK